MGCKCIKSKNKLKGLVIDDDLAKTMEKYCFTQENINQFWRLFLKTDTDRSGTVSADEIFTVIREKPNSIIAPYLIEYISDLEKGHSDKLSFTEFVRSLSKLCLYTPTQIIQFVFKCIDENRDDYLSKDEIMFFLKRQHEGKMIFPNNYLKSIELFKTDRSDKIDWMEFVRLAREVPYIVFPAFRLQNSLRLYSLGPLEWKRVNKRLLKKKKHDAKEAEIKALEVQKEQEKIWSQQIAEWDARDPDL